MRFTITKLVLTAATLLSAAAAGAQINPGNQILWPVSCTTGLVYEPFSNTCVSASGGSVTGSGTTDYLPLWSGTTALADSVIDQGVTNTGYITVSEPEAINDTADATQVNLIPTTHAPATVTGAASIAAPPTVTTPSTLLLPAAPGVGLLYSPSDTLGIMPTELLGLDSTLSVTGTPALGCTTATASQLGCVEPDGTTITVSGGVLTAHTSGGGCMTQMQTIVSSPASSVTFTSIPNTCTDLTLVSTQQISSGGTADFSLQFNGDTASHYDFCFNTSCTPNANHILIGNTIASGSNQFGSTQCTFPAYAQTVGFKTAICPAWGGIGNYAFTLAGDWQSTAAITSITVFPASGSFAVGTVVTLRGE